MVGANCHGFIDRYAMVIGVWRFVEGVNRVGRSGMVVRSRNSGETLRAAIIHYMATSARLQ
jgi:hypothetical protein